MVNGKIDSIFVKHLLTQSLLLLFSDYLLSNNHVNSIIVHKFDFSDEEIMAYYISFLKTLSLKLNNHTVHFFYNEVRPYTDGGGGIRGSERKGTHGGSVIQCQCVFVHSLWQTKRRKEEMKDTRLSFAICASPVFVLIYPRVMSSTLPPPKHQLPV